MCRNRRARIRWLEVSADSARRRAERLARALQSSAPLEAYQSLAAKHAALCEEQRRAVEARGDGVAGAAEELLAAREELARAAGDYERAASRGAELRYVCEGRLVEADRAAQACEGLWITARPRPRACILLA
jgi:hypothetical protein